MSARVLIVDAFGLVLALSGFAMAFRQSFVRRLFGWSALRSRPVRGEGDPVTYVLRISGTMIMVFGIALGTMVTLFSLA